MSNLVSLVNKFTDCRFLNVGSGPKPWVGWNCLDELDTVGIYSMKFNSSCSFPMDDVSQDLVYSSHCIEHLDDHTVSRLFDEARRVLADRGTILIKIPDYDWFLEKYRTKSADLMENIIRYWPSWSWANFNVAESPLNKLSYMFCGYWNYAYGDHLSGKINKGPDSYNGPAQMSEKELRDLFDNRTVREIVQTLRGVCEKDRSLKAFNHQNAWSRKDLIDLLKNHGFQVQTCPKDELVIKYSNLVPDIEFMGRWSMYVEAKKI